MKKLLISTFLTLAINGISAQAAVVNVGNITLQQQVQTQQINITGNSEVQDFYNFTLLSNAIFTSSVLFSGLTSFDTDLLLSNVDLNLQDTMSVINGNTFTLSSGPVSLAAGSYGFFIGGETSQTNGGFYSGSFTLGHPVAVAAVPEAGTTAMFLAGLGLIGMVSRRRKQS